MERNFAVITGASSGIGREAAKTFARRGKNLVIAARRKRCLEILREEILAAHPAAQLEIIVKAVDLAWTENAARFYDEVKDYGIAAWINCAGFGHYGEVAAQDLTKITSMLRLNIETPIILSTLFARDHQDAAGTQLINISSAGGYTLVPNAVTYCATKFCLGAFTEGLARELAAKGAKLKAKVLAPAATRTEFGKVASGTKDYDYDEHFPRYHTSRQMAEFLLALYDSDRTVGIVNRDTFEFSLCDAIFPCAGDSAPQETREAGK